jgi:hypothetical protein
MLGAGRVDGDGRCWVGRASEGERVFLCRQLLNLGMVRSCASATGHWG